MREVVIDGVRYVPAESDRETIGIGVTTRNRPDLLPTVLDAIRKHTPGARVVIVDDASAPPAKDATHRFDANVGIARAKNRCLELLQDCEHIFLFDDDAYPIADDWWRPYVESPEPHLMRLWRGDDAKQLHADSEHVAYQGPRGVMLYAHRTVLDIVGGMDVRFGQWGHEHVDWSNRIHAAGLTTWRYADVVGSDKLIRSLDESGEAVRTVPAKDRARLVESNQGLLDAQRNLAEYREFRTERDIVLTALFTSHPDPQRRGRMSASPEMLRDLMVSLKAHDVVVLADELEHAEHATVERTASTMTNPYMARWLHYWRWLRAHREVRFVWCVDGTDVELLGTPFPLDRGKLYLGTEATTAGSGWLAGNTTPAMREFLAEHGRAQLLNAGLVGGDRETVMRFIHTMLRRYYDALTDGIDITAHVNDMGVLNWVGRDGDFELVTGPSINTTFKANERNAWSTWKHK